MSACNHDAHAPTLLTTVCEDEIVKGERTDELVFAMLADEWFSSDQS